MDVAAMAHAHGVRVCPHAGDLMQVHQHLVRSIPNAWFLEVIPIWKRGPFEHQIVIEDGVCTIPTDIGASTDFTAEAFEKFRVA
jgi:L-alanine-DL-glutamate epimerase-like enolase superfamily enzyme